MICQATHILGENITEIPSENSETYNSSKKQALLSRPFSLARDRYFGRYLGQEKKYFKNEIPPNRKRVHAMEWLHNRKIVFDLLPDDEAAEKVASSSHRIQALACLTYLENEPERENLSLWQIVITLLSGAVGFILARALSALSIDEDADGDTPKAAENADGVIIGSEWVFIAPLISFALLLVVLGMLNRKNNHIRAIAAWARSWSTAIREC